MNGVRRWLFVCLAVLITGLPSPTVSAESVPRGQGLDDVGMAAVLQELETFVVAEKSKQAIPGLSYVVVANDQVVYSKAFGFRTGNGGAPVTTDTLYEIGSASKAFTATMMAMLVEEKKLAWTDRVVDHLPQFRMHDPWVTRELRVADLLCQRSGMSANALDSMAMVGFTREEIVGALRHVEPITSFRSAYAYQNNMWLAAAALIEAKSGLTWEDNVDRRIFGPLRMASSTTSPEVVATMPDVATGHFWDKGVLVPMPADWPYRQWLETYGPAGSIRSTVMDLAQWVRFQINLGAVGGITLLPKSAVSYLHAPKTLNVSATTPSDGGDVMSYGSGWLYFTRNRHPLVWHNGGTIGMHSIVGFLPEAGIGLAMLTNEPSNSVPELALFKLADLVLGVPPATALSLPEVMLDRALKPLPKPDRPDVVPMGLPLPPERYVGTFANPAYGPFEVRVQGGRLEMVFGPLQFVGVLQPYSGNTFRMDWPGWPGMVSVVTFTVPAGHVAQKMTIDTFADVRGGEFVRGAAAAGN